MSEENIETYYMLTYKENRETNLFLVDETGKRVFSLTGYPRIEEFIDSAAEKGFEKIKKIIPKEILQKARQNYGPTIERFDVTEFYNIRPMKESL